LVGGGEAETVGTDEITETNQHLAQDNSAQALCPAEVESLKRRCSGEEVIEAIASNSATFATKTKFAQEKYLKKKRQKHLQQVVVLRPTVMELCETYMKQSRGKVAGLRFDYLASILCHADVHTGGRYLLMDCACGLVAGAMAQQLSGNGRIYRVFRGGCPEKAVLELDLGEARHSIRAIPLEVVQSQDPMSHEWLRAPAEASAGAQMASEEDAAKAERAREIRTERAQQRIADFRDLEAGMLDAVVIAAGSEDAEVAAEALELGLARLGPGGRVAVYGPHLQPLAARQGAMRAGGGFVDVRLIQLFTREYQILPQRTHPHMMAEAQLCEGFLLTASKVIDSDGTTPECIAVDGEAARTDGKRRRRGPR